MEKLQDEIMKIAGDSFDEGGKAVMESMILGIEKLLELQPNISGKELLDVVKFWQSKKYLPSDEQKTK